MIRETEVKNCKVQSKGIIYIENIFLLNLGMNLFLLRLTGRILGKSTSLGRCFCGSAIGSAGYCTVLCLPGIPYVWKVFIGMIPVGLFMTKLGLETKGKRELLYGMGFLFTCSFLLGGFILFLKERLLFSGGYGNSATVTILCGFIGYELADQGLKYWRQKKEERFRKVKLTADRGEIEVWALVDTGCGLVDPLSKRPVAVLEEDVWSQMSRQMRQEKYKVIPFHSIGKEHGFLEGYEVESMEVIGEVGERHCQKVIIAVFKGKLSKNGGYQMILPPELSI